MASLQTGPPVSPPTQNRRGSGRMIAAVVGLALGTAVAIYAAYSSTPKSTAAKSTAASAASVKPPTHILRETMPSIADSYLGTYEKDSPGSYTQVQQFGQLAGRQPNLVLYYASWEEPFQTSFASQAQANGATVIVDLDPTTPKTGISLASIAAGKYDGFLESFARSVLSFGHPVIISFGHEMNGNWYPWGWTRQKPQEYVKAWRHVVTVFRNQGADNVTWLWTFNQVQPNTGPLTEYWPGASYVDWIGLDAYYYYNTDTFSSVFDKSLTEVRELTDKPILISETAVGPVAGQAQKIQGLLAGVQQSGVLGLVWFDEAQDQPPFHQDWRLEGNAAASAAFKSSLAKYLQQP